MKAKINVLIYFYSANKTSLQRSLIFPSYNNVDEIPQLILIVNTYQHDNIVFIPNNLQKNQFRS